MVVLNDSESGLSLLAGFVTAADYYNRFRIRLDESGMREFSIFVYGDGREVAPGETVLSEELLILEGPDGYALLEQYAACLGDRMKAHVPQSVPTGWCSWYYYYSRVTENDVLENLEWLRRHRTELPLDYFQIDDGYQPAPGRLADAVGTVSARAEVHSGKDRRSRVQAGAVAGTLHGAFRLAALPGASGVSDTRCGGRNPLSDQMARDRRGDSRLFARRRMSLAA